MNLIGIHNVLNCLAAAGASLSEGVDLKTIAAGISEIDYVPGRLQKVKSDAPFSVFVDYAHTDDALRNVLSSLTAITEGKLIVVFGCGGDRDKTKRPRMAKVAQEFADRIIITSDNPRSEKASAIIDDIVSGLNKTGRSKADVEPDRESAIAMAIRYPEAGDVVLIAGKGHETYQIIGDNRLDFDDVAVAESLHSKLGAPK